MKHNVMKGIMGFKSHNANQDTEFTCFINNKYTLCLDTIIVILKDFCSYTHFLSAYSQLLRFYKVHIHIYCFKNFLMAGKLSY